MQSTDISIHAPRAGSDYKGKLRWLSYFKFQSTLPVRGATRWRRPVLSLQGRFQSTLPVRGATSSPCCPFAVCCTFQSTLPVRGATLTDAFMAAYEAIFQSTLPVRGATQISDIQKLIDMAFQSTLPVRGATVGPQLCHALHQHFNPRSPCGERPAVLLYRFETHAISIHAPRAGSDVYRAFRR